MNFYVDPAFFVLTALLCIPALVLGLHERPLKAYGTAASFVMLVLLFFSSVTSLCFFVFFLVLSLVLQHLVAGWFAAEDPRRIAKYRVALALQIAPLAIYKVGVLWDVNLLGFLGISYITFKAVAVLIETRDGLITDYTTRDHLCFLVFFAPFTSGPIMRSRDYMDDMRAPRPREDYLEMVYRGLRWIIVGAVYKFILSAIAVWALWFVPQLLGGSGVGAFVAESFFYGCDLFFDFAGYSLMACGVGAFFGVSVPRNFNAPFCAIDMKDFWNRWHMSLSFWFRDFIFMRLTRVIMRRKLIRNRTATACACFMVNFIVMGAWHGLTFDFLAYGVYEGLALCLCEVVQKTKFWKRHHKERGYQICSWAVTMVIVFIGFSFFSGQISRLLLG